MQKTVQLAGKPVVVRTSRRPLKKLDGYCKGGQIVLSCDLTDRGKLEVFLHEALHKLFWILDEDVVEAAADELTDALEITELV